MAQRVEDRGEDDEDERGEDDGREDGSRDQEPPPGPLGDGRVSGERGHLSPDSDAPHDPHDHERGICDKAEDVKGRGGGRGGVISLCRVVGGVVCGEDVGPVEDDDNSCRQGIEHDDGEEEGSGGSSSSFPRACGARIDVLPCSKEDAWAREVGKGTQAREDGDKPRIEGRRGRGKEIGGGKTSTRKDRKQRPADRPGRERSGRGRSRGEDEREHCREEEQGQRGRPC